MAKVFFTSNLRRHVDCATAEAEGATVGEVLARIFATQERLGFYVLDEQGRLRKHMMVLIDGGRVKDRDKLTDPVAASSEIYVMQALSGG
ncbi:MAG: MoaD/ThiS family protein [Rhizobiales bacterium]|nr:MoaD/ThiS family protein [Hyphomicrobiales bacterium]MBI3674395.1 MoaD/ThiS family protein [Hyphomicrobiales bacterium]